jgi:hypothetical protein
MRALSRLETFIQDLIERPAWLLSQRRMHPIELAQALTRALESAALPLADRVIAPDAYVLRLNPDDLRQLGSVRHTLEREYADYLERLAQERQITMKAPVRVTMIAAGEVRPGAVDVSTSFSEGREQRQRSTIAARLDGAPPPAATEVVPRRAEPAPVTTGTAVLELLDERGRIVERFTLNGSAAILGRRTANEVTLADPEVSRRHARIDAGAKGYYIYDLGSMNGTLVNGRRITAPHPLADGDVLVLGQSRLRFRVPATGQRRAGG